MPNIEYFMLRAYTYTPLVLLSISLIAWILGKWNKKKGKDSKRYYKVSSWSFIIGVIIFLIVPTLGFIILLYLAIIE